MAVVTLAFVGTVLAVGSLTPAAADPGQVTFGGRPSSTDSCPSRPSPTSVRVVVGGTVDFVNRTGRTATLWVGSAGKAVPDRSFVPVTFMHPGTVVVEMLPDCPLDVAVHQKMTVYVGPGPSAGGGSMAAPRIGSASSPEPPPGASGLLTLIAAVGVIGVLAAAIRAILVFRATPPHGDWHN